MWWQILPPMGVIGGCIAVQFCGMGVSHLIFTGRPSDRRISESTDFEWIQKLAYKRDTYNVGNEYEGRGLDCIQDEDD